MTRLYISADLEGIGGVVTPQHCAPGTDRTAYDWAVSQLDAELTAVVETALEAGATEILINDAHCGMTNLTLDEVHPQVRLLTGKPKRLAMMAGLTSDFDGVMLIGYHAKAGTQQGVLAHTFHHKLFDVAINGVSYGEGGINTLYASLKFGVPLVLASGDRAFVEEITPLVPGVATVETKVGLAHTAAQCHPLESLLEDYETKTRQVMANAKQWRKNLLQLTGPYELTITFINPLAADTADLIPGLERVDGRTLRYTANDFEAAYRMLQSCYTILGATATLES